VSDEIINFYKKAADTEEPQKPIEEQKETPAPALPQPDEPFDKFLLELAEKLKNEKVITEKQQETFEEQIKQPVLEEDKNSDDPFKKFIGSFANILKEDELVNREENIKEATISFINKLKEQPVEPFIIDDQPLVKTKKKYLPPKIKQKVEKLPQVIKKEEPVVAEQADEPVKEEPKDENKYVQELKTADKSNKKLPEKIKSVSDIKSIVEKQVAEILSRYPNLGFTGGGGGTNAVQYAEGGTMRGDLNVTGKFLSGGVDISTLFGTGGGAVSGIPDRLISGSQSLILNPDGSISFPDNFITAPDGEVLNIQSETISPSSFSRISLSPYAFFAYDNEGNSISFDVVDNTIELISKNEYSWKFNNQGVLVGPNNTLTVTSLSSLGRILSGGKDLTQIFLTSSTDAQTLSWIASSYQLSISNGNLVSLASLSSAGGGIGRDDVNTIVISNSANWNTAYQSVSSQSLNTNSNVQFNQVNANVYLSGGVNLFNLLSSSGGGGTGRDDVNTVVIENSANWIDTTTVVQNNSANWDTAYNTATALQSISGNYLSLSGGTVTGKTIISHDNDVVDLNSSYTLSIQRNAGSTWLEILNQGGPDQGAFFGMSNNDFEQWNYQGGDIIFYTAETPTDGNERLIIKNDGKVGIGTINPASELQVDGTITTDAISFTTPAEIYSNDGNIEFIHVDDNTNGNSDIFFKIDHRNSDPGTTGYITIGTRGGEVKARYSGQVAGMTTDVVIESNTGGYDGNMVILTFDGVATIDTVIAIWNAAYPSNQITLVSGDGTQVPDDGQAFTLTGGGDAAYIQGQNSELRIERAGNFLADIKSRSVILEDSSLYTGTFNAQGKLNDNRTYDLPNADGTLALESYVSNNFLNLTGGVITNDLTVLGNISALGTATFANTVFTTTSSLSVVHLGTGPALYVGNFGNDHIATFVDLQNGLEMMHIGGLSSSFPNVGVKTGNPNKDFTVRGEISASGTIWNSEGNSTQWNTAYINVSSQSLNIDSNVQFNQVSAGAIVTSSNSKLDLVGFGPNTAYLTTTPDDTTALFMGVFGADLRANNYVSIATNTGDVSRLWTFGTDGSLSFPDGSTQTTAFTGNPESGGATPIKRFDYTTVANIDISYSGTAPFGTIETNPIWNLVRLTYNDNGTISNQASAINSWTGRLTATYV
jgi:hypothetical protein